MKIRVTIDTDECSFDNENESSYTNGVVDIDIDGVGRWWYGSPSYFVMFKDVEVIECEHDNGTRRVREATDDMFDTHNECVDCGKDMNEVIA